MSKVALLVALMVGGCGIPISVDRDYRMEYALEWTGGPVVLEAVDVGVVNSGDLRVLRCTLRRSREVTRRVTARTFDSYKVVPYSAGADASGKAMFWMSDLLPSVPLRMLSLFTLPTPLDDSWGWQNAEYNLRACLGAVVPGFMPPRFAETQGLDPVMEQRMARESTIGSTKLRKRIPMARHRIVATPRSADDRPVGDSIEMWTDGFGRLDVELRYPMATHLDLSCPVIDQTLRIQVPQ